MMPAKFVAIDSTIKSFDLDNVYDIIQGYSGKLPQWTSLVMYEPIHDTLVEARSAPPDIRGGGAEETEEITLDYLEKYYGLGSKEVDLIRSNPVDWKFIDLRKPV